MKKILIALFMISVYGYPEAAAQTRWVEQWISMDSSKPRLAEAWIEDRQKRILEKRTLNFNSTTREDWSSIALTEFNKSKMTKIELYSKQFEKGQKPNVTMLCDYDRLNRKVKLSVYNNNGEAKSEPVIFTTYEYNSKSNLVSETTTYLVDYFGKPTQPQVSKTEYKYTDTLLIEEWKMAKDQSILDHYSYKYDSAGRRIEKKLLDKIDHLEQTLYTWKYDGSGRVTEDKTIFNNGETFRRHTFIYNDKGDLVEELEFGDETNNAIVKITFKYELVKSK